MEFWAYYRILKRRRWLLVAALLAAIVVAIAANRPQVGDFDSSANLSVPSMQRFFFVYGTQGSQNLAVDRTPQALDLVRGRDLAERVVQRFNLSMRPDELQRRLIVEKDPTLNLIRVSVSGKTPAEAVGLTNAVADTAASYDQELQRREATLAREFIEKQADGVATNPRGAEDALLDFQQQNGVALATPVNAEVAGLETQARQVDLSLAEIDARLTADRAQLHSQAATRSDKEITENPIAQILRGQLVQLEVALTSELATHTERYPSVVTTKAKIQAIKDRLKDELSKVVSTEKVAFNPIYDAIARDVINLEAEKVALQAKREGLRQGLVRMTRALPDTAQKQIEQSRLVRSVDIQSRVFANLQAQVTDARLKEQEVQVLGSLTVVDQARTARRAPFRGLQFKVTLASVLGVLGGAGLAFFLEYLDDTLRTPENAERLLGVPALVAVPFHNPPFDEAYRLLRVNVEAKKNGNGRGKGGGGGAFVVTSSRPREGSSTVVANLARAFARAGRRTIVVDAALRQPVQHVNFLVANSKGLTEVLRGEAALDDTLAPTTVPNLSVLPSGAMRPGADELLGSTAMADVLAELRQRADVVLVDTPAAGASTDAITVARFASGVLLVLDARRRAPLGVAEQVKSQLARVGAKVLGLVVTKVRPDLVHSYVFQERLDAPPRRLRLPPPPPLAVSVSGAVVLFFVLGVLAGLAVKAAQTSGVLLSIWTTAAQLGGRVP
ncbi:MAG: polysaccharide biosynthesis tyrosine autokinase [Bacillati bacterium ANGP1]|uniref:Polysaccharide biosynthesis tyrosine autokinase n=1 Tax=Candidatus Segetimicrobium genomatis TaxID=2569760 RepID=A0A537JHC5_9BACT|nr:MAG: polysaccharide biosynthesis tyrosine autokinase [Terrabacteria group bacterium ANGP1]